MTEKELIHIMNFIADMYPSKFKFPKDTKEESKVMIENWLSMLGAYNHETIMMLLKDFIPKHPEWPLTVGEIVERYREVSKPPEERMTAEEAWELALKEVPFYSRYRPQETMDKLPESIQRAIRAMGGFNIIYYSEREDPFVRKTFIDAYIHISERIEQTPHQTLIESLKKDTKMLGEGMKG